MRIWKLIRLLLFLTSVFLLSINSGAAQVVLVCEDSFHHGPRLGFYEDIVCETTCPSGYGRYYFQVWHEGGEDTGIDEAYWEDPSNDTDCRVHIKSHALPPIGEITVYYRVWARNSQWLDWIREGKWLLVHGSGGNTGDWNAVKTVMEGSPYSVPSGNIKVVNLEDENHVMLGNWTSNLVDEMEELGLLSPAVEDGSVKVIAHSIGSAVTLFLLRAAYELQFGDVVSLQHQIYVKCNIFWEWGKAEDACFEIGDKLGNLDLYPDMAAQWITAAKKIGGVYIYHTTLKGGCLVCDGQLLEDDYASMCALGTVDILLWEPKSTLTWDGCKRIVNIYGFGADLNDCIYIWPPSCPFGEGPNDGRVKDDHQRLSDPEDGSTNPYFEGTYTEVFGGYYCHGDFQNSESDAAEDLVNKIVENPTLYPCPSLCGNIFDGNGGPLTNKCPYLVTCNVVVPENDTLTIQAGAKVYFESGYKITAIGTLNANGDSDNPIYLISEDDPHRGIKLMEDLVLKNGGEFKPGP